MLSVVTEKQFQEFGKLVQFKTKLYGMQPVTVVMFIGDSVQFVEFNKQN